jgi:hypothetical protein
MSGTPEDFAAEGSDQWLTATLRPAGVLAGEAIDRFIDSLTVLAENANLVVVDFGAATVPAPDTLAEALRRPGELLSAPDRCLLLAGADPALLRALDRCGGQIATVDADPAEVSIMGPIRQVRG